MNNNRKEKQGVTPKASVSPKKKPFVEPKVKVYSKLENITLFTSTLNASGGTFF